MAQHTPGPWGLHGFKWEQGGFAIEAKEAPGGIALTIGGLGTIEEANAYLIAEAPNLLAIAESLDAFQRYFEEHSEQPGYMPGNQFYSDKAI